MKYHRLQCDLLEANTTEDKQKRLEKKAEIFDSKEFPDIVCPLGCGENLVSFFEKGHKRFRCPTQVRCSSGRIGTHYRCNANYALEIHLRNIAPIVRTENDLRLARCHPVLAENSLCKTGYIVPKICENQECVETLKNCCLIDKSFINMREWSDGDLLSSGEFSTGLMRFRCVCCKEILGGKKQHRLNNTRQDSWLSDIEGYEDDGDRVVTGRGSCEKGKGGSEIRSDVRVPTTDILLFICVCRIKK